MEGCSPASPASAYGLQIISLLSARNLVFIAVPTAKIDYCVFVQEANCSISGVRVTGGAGFQPDRAIAFHGSSGGRVENWLQDGAEKIETYADATALGAWQFSKCEDIYSWGDGKDWVSADRGDNTITVYPNLDAPVQLFATTLTGNKSVTLDGTAAHAGDRFKVVRNAATPGAFTLTVYGTAWNVVIASGANGWVEAAHNGTAWVLTGTGELP
jgi:hypothetical protein